MPNLYGDIISDVAAQITGSVGLGSSSNIGVGGAMFEAIHGSAPDIAGKDIANPSGLLLSSCLMLHHIGQPQVADLIQNAWTKVIEDGIHTPDIYNDKLSKKKVGTREFTKVTSFSSFANFTDRYCQPWTKAQGPPFCRYSCWWPLNGLLVT